MSNVNRHRLQPDIHQGKRHLNFFIFIADSVLVFSFYEFNKIEYKFVMKWPFIR